MRLGEYQNGTVRAREPVGRHVEVCSLVVGMTPGCVRNADVDGSNPFTSTGSVRAS